MDSPIKYFSKENRQNLYAKIDEFFLLDKNKKFPELDGLRGWAILMVFMAHLGPYVKEMYDLRPDTFSLYIYNAVFYFPFIGSWGGHVGVDLFFMLSGFLMFMTILNKAPTLKDFAWKRLTRLLPAHFIILLPHLVRLPLLVAFLNVFFIVHFFPKLENINLVTWSLGYELIFYVICAIWFIAARNVKFMQTWTFFFIATTAIYCSQWVFTQKLLAHDITYPDMTRFIAFFFGIAMAKLYFSEPALWKKLEKFFVFGSILGIYLVVQSKYYWDMQFLMIHLDKYWMNGEFLLLDVGFFLIFGCMLTSGPHWLKKIFANRALRVIGAISYSLYLVHYIYGLVIALRFVDTVYNTAYRELGYIFFAFVINIALGIFLFHFLEKPYFLRNRYSKPN